MAIYDEAGDYNGIMVDDVTVDEIIKQELQTDNLEGVNKFQAIMSIHIDSRISEKMANDNINTFAFF